MSLDIDAIRNRLKTEHLGPRDQRGDIVALLQEVEQLRAACQSSNVSIDRAKLREALTHAKHRNHQHSPGLCSGCAAVEGLIAP
jgi:hypothetical protein